MNNPDKISVVLVEDDRHYRAYVASVLKDTGRFAVVAEAASAEEAARWGAEIAPRVALVDVVLPGARGTAVVPRLLERYPQLLVIMLTARTDDEVILEAIRAGAAGYVLKGAASQEILDAVDGALAGGAPMSPAIARRVLGLMRAAPSGATQAVAAKTGMGGELRALTERGVTVPGSWPRARRTRRRRRSSGCRSRRSRHTSRTFTRSGACARARRRRLSLRRRGGGRMTDGE